jgi:hypothetical protein
MRARVPGHIKEVLAQPTGSSLPAPEDGETGALGPAPASVTRGTWKETTMPNAVVNRLERFLSTGAGARFLEEAESEAAAKEAAVQKRRDLAAERAEFHRRETQVRPELARLAKEAWALANRAKAEYEALRKRAADVGRAVDSEFLSNLHGLRRTEADLLRSAPTRIVAAIEEADEALRGWSERRSALYRWRSEKAINWDGTEEFVKRYGTNEAGVDALKKAIEDARIALERLALVAEPAEEVIAQGIDRLKAAIAESHRDPPPLVMQQFDHNGQPVGKPVEMTVGK